MSGRRLVSVRRAVPEARRVDYEAAWADLHREATALGAHAWRFRSASAADAFLEFLEFKGDADPRAHDAVRAAIADLDGVGPGAAEEWTEVRSVDDE